MGISILLYGLIGIIPAVWALKLDTFMFASILHAYTLMFASLTLASSAGTVLFIKEEAEILLHRPVHPGQLLRAKMAVLVGSSLVLALSLNAAGLITGAWSRGSTWLFLPVHACTSILLMVFSTGCIVLVYNLCLKWLGRERLDNLLATLQMLLAVSMVLSGQILPRAFDMQNIASTGELEWWVLLLPPTWFGGLDVLAVTGSGSPMVWAAAGLGLGATALVCWLAFGVLAKAYGAGLMTLNESSGSLREKRYGRKLRALLRLPLMRWWMRDPAERQAFILVTAYMFRDREMKLRLFPAIAPLLVMPLVMVFTSSGANRAEVVLWIQSFSACYMGIIPLQALMCLQRSEHWRATGLFYMTPLPHWAPLFHGTRKAVLLLLTLPMLILQAAALALFQWSATPFIMVIPSLFFLPAFSLISGLLGTWLPLSKPSEDQRDASTGCIFMAVVLVVAGTLGAVAALSWKLGWFWLFLILEALAMTTIFHILSAMIRGSTWTGHEKPSQDA